MTVSFGSDRVTFTSFKPDPDAFPDDEGTFSPLEGSAATVPGCRHRPFRSSARGGAGAARAEYPQVGVGVEINWWETTCPPVPAALATKASDNITVNGLTFRVLGDARPFRDIAGRVFKVSLLSERQEPIA